MGVFSPGLGWGRNPGSPGFVILIWPKGISFIVWFLPCSVIIFPSLRPPNVPPKPQKHRKSRPRSQYNAKLFNGDLETFVKVLHQSLVADLHASHYNGLSLPWMRRVIMSKSVLGLFASPRKINIIFPEVREERIFGLRIFWRKNKYGRYHMVISYHIKEKALFFSFSQVKICRKKEKTNLIKYFLFSCANEKAHCICFLNLC